MKPSRGNNTTFKKSADYVSEVGPPLPGRRPQRVGPVPVPVPSPLVKPITPTHSSEESLASYDDIKELIKSPNRSSEDEDDSTYEAFVHVQQKITKMSNALPKKTKNVVDEPTEQYEATEVVTVKEEIIETKNAGSIETIREKFQKNQISSSTTKESDVTKKISAFSNKNTNSLVKELIKKSNTPSNINCDPESACDAVKTKNKNCESPTSPQKFKGTIGLSPPVIQKVPVVPVKPKVKDKPFIGKRPPFSSFRQITGDR